MEKWVNLTVTNHTYFSVLQHDKDIEETKKLLSLTTRIAQQAVLNEHLAKLTALRSIAESKIKEQSKELNQSAPKLSGFTKVIETYGWDQSDKFIKVYITSLNDISKIDPNNVTCDFTDKSFDLIIRNLNSINYTLSIVSLFKNINPKESSFKVSSRCDSTYRLNHPKFYFRCCLLASMYRLNQT
jgi:calcyclin binding protein